VVCKKGRMKRRTKRRVKERMKGRTKGRTKGRMKGRMKLGVREGLKRCAYGYWFEVKGCVWLLVAGEGVCLATGLKGCKATVVM